MKLHQYLQFSNHIHYDCFLVMTNNDLIPIIDCNEKWFMQRSPLEHLDSHSVSWCFHIVSIIYQSCCYFFPEVRVLFSSGLKWLIVGRWSEYSCLGRESDKFHVFDKVFDFVCYEACRWRWRCRWWNLVRADQYNFFIFHCSLFFFLFFFHVQFLNLLDIIVHIGIAFFFVVIQFIG